VFGGPAAQSIDENVHEPKDVLLPARLIVRVTQADQRADEVPDSEQEGKAANEARQALELAVERKAEELAAHELDERLRRALAQLRRDGFAVIPDYWARDRALALRDKLEAYLEPGVDQEYEQGAWLRFWDGRKHDQGVRRLYHVEKVEPELKELRFDPFVLDIATAYFNVGGWQMLCDGLSSLGNFRLLLGDEPEAGSDLGLREAGARPVKGLICDLAREDFNEQTLRVIEDLIAFLRRPHVPPLAASNRRRPRFPFLRRGDRSETPMREASGLAARAAVRLGAGGQSYKSRHRRAPARSAGCRGRRAHGF